MQVFIKYSFDGSNNFFNNNIFFYILGARLKGVFSRLDYQRNPGAAKSAVRSIRQVLPLG
jgi:hypothetical protein